jgi:hypothetical protein
MAAIYISIRDIGNVCKAEQYSCPAPELNPDVKKVQFTENL